MFRQKTGIGLIVLALLGTAAGELLPPPRLKVGTRRVGEEGGALGAPLS